MHDLKLDSVRIGGADPAIPSLSTYGVGASGAAGAVGETGFAEALAQAASSVVAPQQNASEALNQFAQGNDGELHQTLLSMDKADISLKYFVSVRNRCLEAYREVMRMGS